MTKLWTGERLETFILNETTIEHLHRYALALTICVNKDVLDIASGEGYGSNFLAAVARNVTGVDISQNAVLEAANKYKKSNLLFKEGSASKIPLDSNSVDVVVSFETIEHHDKHLEMIAEIKRVLKPGGVLLISSPDKKYYSDIPQYSNPFHIKELYFDEFKALMNLNFKNTRFSFQKIVLGSFIIPVDLTEGFSEYTGDYSKIETIEDFAPVYNICIASDNEVPLIEPSMFNGKHIINNMIEQAVRSRDLEYKNTWSYRIGHFLLYPLKLIKKI